MLDLREAKIVRAALLALDKVMWCEMEDDWDPIMLEWKEGSTGSIAAYLLKRVNEYLDTHSREKQRRLEGE
jgi:hypothetical protein